MIEWDEILEDIDWKRGAVIIIGGIGLIVAAVFLGLNWHRANSMRTLLEGDQAQIEEFQKTWTEPKKQIADWNHEKKELEQELADKQTELPESIDRDAIKQSIRTAAAANGVTIVRLTDADKIDGYCLILEIGVLFSSESPRSAANFLASLAELPVAHTVKSQPVSLLGGNKEVTLSFFYFDKKGWDEEKNCMGMVVPEIPERDIAGIYVFGGDLPGLKSKVEQDRANLADVKRMSIETCGLQVQVEMLESKLFIIKSKLGK